MPAMYEIRWLSNGQVESFAGSRGNYYEFSESDRLDLLSEPIWCHRCATIAHGEYLSTVEEIDGQISKLNDPSSADYHMARHGLVDEICGTGESFLQQRLARLRRRRLWRAGRQSPPKCIHCGTTEILWLPLGVPIAIPNRDSKLQIDCVGLCSTNFNEWYFTPEGDRIARDTQPTYWHHPELDKPEHRSSLMAWIRSKIKGDSSG